MDTLTEKIQTLKTEHSALLSKLESNQLPKESIASFADNLNFFTINFESSELENKRLLVGLLVDSIHLDGNQVQIKWKL